MNAIKLRRNHYLGATLILLAILPLSNGSRLLAAQNEFMQTSTSRSARVIDHIAEKSDKATTKNKAVYSVVSFMDDDGKQRTARTNVASYPAPSKIGENLVVRTHDIRRDDVRVHSFAGLWLESVFYLAPGFLTLSMGVFLIWRTPQSPEALR